MIIADMRKEASMLARLRHDNILNFQGLVVDASGTPKYIITERAVSNLSGYLEARSRGGKLTRAELTKICKHVLRGLVYLHTLDPPVVHRDIKPENILVCDVDGTISFKIGDVGLARFATSSTFTAAGTLLYMAPELLEGSDDIRCDVFSFGMMAAQLVLEHIASASASLGSDYGMKGRFRAVEDAARLVGEPLASVLRGCTQKRAEDRLHAVEALVDVEGPGDAAVCTCIIDEPRRVVLARQADAGDRDKPN